MSPDKLASVVSFMILVVQGSFLSHGRQHMRHHLWSKFGHPKFGRNLALIFSFSGKTARQISTLRGVWYHEKKIHGIATWTPMFYVEKP